MMGILQELLKEIKSSELDVQVKELCDLITEEEKVKQIDALPGPVGSNVFLTLRVSDAVSASGQMVTSFF